MMDQQELVDHEVWARKVRGVDSSIHAVLAAQQRKAAKRGPLLRLPPKPFEGLKERPTDKPLPSGS